MCASTHSSRSVTSSSARCSVTAIGAVITLRPASRTCRQKSSSNPCPKTSPSSKRSFRTAHGDSTSKKPSTDSTSAGAGPRSVHENAGSSPPWCSR